MAFNPGNAIDQTPSPAQKSPEMTTKSPISPDQTIRPEKLVDNRKSAPKQINKPLRLQKLVRSQAQPLAQRLIQADYKVVNAYQTPNLKFVIDQISRIPGQLFAKLVSVEKTPYREYYKPVNSINRPIHQSLAVLPKKTKTPKTQFAKVAERLVEDPSKSVPKESPIVVKAVGRANANPGIVLPNGQNLLILEPSARSIVGEQGTAISAPLSRAFVRRNSGTTILFRPDSVAIAGPGGTAHAQADLIVDYIDE